MAEAATLARPYAKAVFMAARDAKAFPAWSRALSVGAGLAADARVAQRLTDPRRTLDQAVSMFAGLASPAIDPGWQNFVRLLAQNKRLHVLSEIALQFEALRAQYENELAVEVTSATPMDPDQQAKFSAALKQRFRRAVRMTLDVDPKLLGGAVVRAGDLVIDGSISGRLQRLASDLDS